MEGNLSIESKIRLNNGVLMPTIGLGVYQIPNGFETEQAVLWALEAGYRHIDTASFYGNEASVGRAIKSSGVPRQEIFITTKLWPTDFFTAERACNKSLEKLGLDYVDLYLIHWPSPIGKRTAWKALEKIYVSGLAKAIGVSNYSIGNLKKLIQSSKIKPTVNQVEFSPFLFRQDLLEFCQTNQIQLEAYSPLTRGKRLDDPKIHEMAAKYDCSPAQILIRWSLQHGNVVIPKSSSKKRIIENIDVFNFEINKTDMLLLDGLNENYRTLFK